MTGRGPWAAPLQQYLTRFFRYSPERELFREALTIMSLSDVSPSAPAARVSLWRDLLGSLRENSPIVLFSVLYGLAPFLIARAVAIPAPPYHDIIGSYVGFIGFAAVAMFAVFAIWYLYQARIRKIPNFQAEAWRRIRTDFLRRDRILLALPVLALWPIVGSAFSYIKSAIPLIQPFYLDEALQRWDRLIHFGTDPWRILQPLLGHMWITYGINFGYALWFFVLQAMLVLQAAATGDRKRRMQFLLTMALAWSLIGNLAAVLMSSAGPCYYALVSNGPNPFAPLMEYLHGVAANLSMGAFGYDLHIPFAATLLQDLLWQSYATSDSSLAMGISAAPSMHIASSWIMARLLWSKGRKAAVLGSLFLLLIFLGSIHLGWHYAIDGYLAVAGAWLLWRCTGWLLDRPAVQRYLWPEDDSGPVGAPALTRTAIEGDGHADLSRCNTLPFGIELDLSCRTRR
jgi:PAP2 superfamily